MNHFDFFKKLIGARMTDIFLQPLAGLVSIEDAFIINFEGECQYSLHTFTSLRISDGKRVLLTSRDQFFDADRVELDDDEIARSRKNLFEGTLLHENICWLKSLLGNSLVRDVNINAIGDLTVTFDNSVVIEVRIDALYEDFECYRLLEFSPSKEVTHCVARMANENIEFTFEYDTDEDE
ncbi:MAG: hypothetical protein IJX38_00215 [Clostridia bacterium]|nr:hypothetical protein [Clostridia bacterium]